MYSTIARYASLADTRVGKRGGDFIIKRTRFGKALFAARDIGKGELITAYDGELLHVDSLGSTPRTHLLRIPDSDYVWDGHRVSERLHYSRDTKSYSLTGPEPGYGSIANSSSRKSSNAKLVWVYDDRNVRNVGYNAETQATFPGRNLRPKRAYLIAKKDIAKGTEITWFYQVEIDSDETEPESEYE